MWNSIEVNRFVLNPLYFDSGLAFHRKCSTLPTLLMMWRVTSILTQATKSVFTWIPTSSKCFPSVSIISIIASLHLIFNIFFSCFSTGAVSARNIQLVKKKQMRCQGVVCATKVRTSNGILRTCLLGPVRHVLMPSPNQLRKLAIYFPKYLFGLFVTNTSASDKLLRNANYVVLIEYNDVLTKIHHK